MLLLRQYLITMIKPRSQHCPFNSRRPARAAPRMGPRVAKRNLERERERERGRERDLFLPSSGKLKKKKKKGPLIFQHFGNRLHTA